MAYRLIIALLVPALLLPALVGAQANDSVIVRQQIGFDTTAPTVPTNVTLEPVASSQIDVTWDASFDALGVIGYEVWRDGVALATVTDPTTSYSDIGLTPETLYAYTVRAYDLAGNYSGFSSSTATTTLAVPVVPPATTTPSTGGPITSSFVGFTAFKINAEAHPDRIDLALSALTPFVATIRFGTTYDGDAGTLLLDTYRRTHTTSITGLVANTTYSITIIATDGKGHRYEKTILVTTTLGTDAEAPENPMDFTATAKEEGIALSWNNPPDQDFDRVRIMRLEGEIPVDPYDGALIYEGTDSTYNDSDVAAGRQYGYAVFARDRSGNYSSGAIAYARAFDPDGIGDAGITVPYPGTTTHDIAEHLTITQDGKTVRGVDGVYTLTPAPFTISIPTEVFPRVLKSIIVTLTHPEDRTKTFSFLLRTNDAKDRYLAHIGALKDAGTYEATISVLDLNSQSIMTDRFEIDVIDSGSYSGIVEKAAYISAEMARMIMLALFILFLTYASRKLWHRGTNDAKEVYNDGY